MAVQFVRGEDRFKIDLDIGYGRSGPSAAIDHVTIATTTTGKPKRKRYTVIAEGLRAYHEAVTARLDEGYLLEVDGFVVAEPTAVTFTPQPALEKLVEADPDRGEHWLALADAWQKAGDPRGDCIHLERALVGMNDPAEYMRRKNLAESARRTRSAHVWGPLGRDAYRLRVTFKNGLVDEIILDAELGAPGRSTKELLAIAKASPFSRFVRTVRVAELKA